MKLNNYNRWILSSVAVLALTACGGSSNNDNNNSGGSDDIPAKPTKNSIIHNGTVYGTVVSPETGRVWLDRNLGADRVCTAYNDAQCFGDYYQWGRGYDGHQDPHSDTSKTMVADINNPHHMFVLTQIWHQQENIDTILSVRWNVTDGSGICPAGFYVASHNDFFYEYYSIIAKENLDYRLKVNDHYNIAAFHSFLKLPSAGIRSFRTGEVIFVGEHVSMWSTSSSSSYLINDDTPPSLAGNAPDSVGMPIRCIKVK